MDPQNQPNQPFNPTPTNFPPTPNTAPVVPPPPPPSPVYSSGTTAATSTGSGLTSIILGVVGIVIIAGGAWWWMVGGGPGSSTGGPNDGFTSGGSYANPFGTPDGGSTSGGAPTSGSVSTQSGGGTSLGSGSSTGAKSCLSFFDREIDAQEFYISNNVKASGGPVIQGTYKPTSSVSSQFASSVQIPSNLRVVSKLYPDPRNSELYIFCPSDVESVISFYNGYFSNKNNWAVFTKMTTNGQGEIRESWAAISKTNPIGVYFGVSSPNNFINQPTVSMIATYPPSR